MRRRKPQRRAECPRCGRSVRVGAHIEGLGYSVYWHKNPVTRTLCQVAYVAESAVREV